MLGAQPVRRALTVYPDASSQHRRRGHETVLTDRFTEALSGCRKLRAHARPREAHSQTLPASQSLTTSTKALTLLGFSASNESPIPVATR